jgi:hypothetical protein
MDNSAWESEAQQSTQQGASQPLTATASAPTGETVNMRKTPGGEYMLKIPLGTELPVLEQRNGSTKTQYNGFTGWVKDEYLAFGTPAAEQEKPEVVRRQPDTQQPGILSLTVDEVCALRQSARDIIQMCDQLLAGVK